MEPDKVTLFLDLYKQLEDALEDKYRHTRRRFSSAVFEFVKDYDSAPIRDKLDVCREVRNLLTHNPNLDGLPIVTPSDAVVAAMGEVLDFVKRPPLALDFATKDANVMKADLNQKILPLMEIMDKNGYSHIPIMNEGQLCGVFSVGSAFQYILRSGGKELPADTKVRDLHIYIDVENHLENYVFVPKDETYIAVRKKFEKVQGKNRRVSAVFITETGKPGERLLGMLTPWDVMGDPEE